jgi:hypothetical protein
MRKRIAVLEEQLTGATPHDLSRLLANGALVRALQALGVDATAGGRAAIDSLRVERTIP